jgi:outer membrane protein TolC
MTSFDVTPPGARNPAPSAPDAGSARPNRIAVGAALAGLLAPLCASAAPLTLEEAVRLALERNERAQIATEQSAAANARVDRARSIFFPDVTITGTYTRQPDNESGRSPEEFFSSAALQLTLLDMRAFPLYRAALREAEATALESEDQRRLVAFEAADAYLLTLGVQQVSEAARRRQSLAQRTREEAEVRFKAGLVSSNDVTRATLELATAEQAATRAAGDAQTALLELAYVVGAPVEAPLAGVEGMLPESIQTGVDAEALARRAAEHRPDLASSIKRLESAQASAAEPLWRWVPTLSLTGRYVRRNTQDIAGFPEDWSATLGATWFLFDGGERFAERAERNALARIAALTRDATARRVALDVRTALVALEIADAAVRQATVGADVARKNAAETDVLYRQGLARALEVADANVRLFEAEVALARERYARAQAWLGLRAALGQDPLGREAYP